jgi:hypothetical protein
MCRPKKRITPVPRQRAPGSSLASSGGKAAAWALPWARVDVTPPISSAPASVLRQ